MNIGDLKQLQAVEIWIYTDTEKTPQFIKLTFKSLDAVITLVNVICDCPNVRHVKAINRHDKIIVQQFL